ncbi:TonB-dependent siderophore receptor [Thalassotalea euphylliae]|uniref:TonB-dependent siderophore receptor n=1 Tax=Thalassotalea euphylliae TaxID=1655234 RepID=UPI00362D8324
MKLNRTFALSSLVLAMGINAQAANANQQTGANNIEDVENILIVGVRSDRVSKGATGLTMELNETPQSISVISSDLIESFAATNLNDALKLATGLTVEEWETNRTNYTSRGFDIKNTQIDGVGMPNNWGIVTGPMESYAYESIEVIRGANGLLTGVGNAAGTINYVRKRPTNENEGEIGVSIGSDSFKRLQADYSALLTDSGSWAGRVVVAVEDSESYLDGLENDRAFVYGVVDGQLTDNSTLTVGFSYQDANTDGNMWGGLVLNHTDGTQAEFDESASTAQEWTTWDTENTSAFVEYTYVFDNNWEVKTTYNYRKSEDPAKLFYVFGAIDKETGLGLSGWPGRYDDDFEADLFDINVIGDYSLFGRTHELTLGASSSKSTKVSHTYAPLSGFGPTPAFPYEMDAIPEPEWGPKTEYADIDLTLNRIFGSTKINVNDDLFVIAGFNAIDFEREGLNSGVEVDNDEDEISPYIGATYAITEDVNAYVSYSDIYQPQERYDFDGYFLDPTKGINVEAGLKAQWLDDRLLTTFAVFTAEQDDLAAFAGVRPDGRNYYKGVNVESKGVEIEVVGRLTDNLNAVIGYTHVEVEDEDGEDTHEWNPNDTINFAVDYTLPQLPEVQIGLGGKWQSDTKNVDFNIKQDSYLLLNAFVRWDINDQLVAQANINNVTDEKYINSLYNVGYYGAPINGKVSLTYSF